MARSEGFEPPANGFEGHCSIQLSYERIGCGEKPAREKGPAVPAEPLFSVEPPAGIEPATY